MQHRNVIEAVDRSLRFFLNEEQKLFGGILVVFGGDWKQGPPVVLRGSQAQILNATFKCSKLWPNVQQHTLKTNMRVLLHGCQDEKEFLRFQANIGTGASNRSPDEQITVIPSDMVSNATTIREFASEIYRDICRNYRDPHYFLERAVLTPRNQAVEEINETVLDMLPTAADKIDICLSSDTIEDDDNAVRFPIEVLNTLTPNGLPCHRLKLAKNAVIILLRNLNFHDGAVNGTRLLVQSIHRFVLKATIISADEKLHGREVLIPRIPMSPTDGIYPFTMRRRQFPVRLAFAMTMNKSQEQTLKKVGVFLPQPVFAHGQLYVAVTRVTSGKNIKFFFPDGTEQLNHGKQTDGSYVTHNIVYREILEY